VFSNIVVGTDGSDTAALAVILASDLARQHGAVLHVVNAYRVSAGGVAVVHAGAMAAADNGLSGEVARAASEKLLSEVAQAIGGVNVTTRAVVGNPADVVIDLAGEVGADLIVVGSKGMRGARRVIGSVPNTIAHRIGVTEFRQLYRGYLGGAFVASISLLAADSVSATSHVIGNRLDDRHLRRLTLKTLGVRTSDEKRFLRTFVIERRNTVRAPMSDGVSGGLVA